MQTRYRRREIRKPGISTQTYTAQRHTGRGPKNLPGFVSSFHPTRLKDRLKISTLPTNKPTIINRREEVHHVRESASLRYPLVEKLRALKYFQLRDEDRFRLAIGVTETSCASVLQPSGERRGSGGRPRATARMRQASCSCGTEEVRPLELTPDRSLMLLPEAPGRTDDGRRSLTPYL